MEDIKMSLKKSKMQEAEKEIEVTQSETTEESNDRNSIAMSERLQQSVDLMARKFGVNEEYVLTQYADKGKDIKISMASSEFEITCVIKHPDQYGFSEY